MADYTRLEGKIKKIASLLTSDRELRKDILQEMRIYLWQADSKHTDSYLLQGAKFKALDYIKKHCGREIPSGTLEDIESLLMKENNKGEHFYDRWSDVDKNTERFLKGNSA